MATKSKVVHYAGIPCNKTNKPVANPTYTYHWENVTCKKCLEAKPKLR
ncbi:hypothetical protein SAMN05444682_101731 [Parapedobacter indicus]|uniref:Uncharacterized protein n=1 Tax=Parapedobacter indicus TaxID=1477437 RepID=A0A1I3E229_9SPHI|nr:hypothetical protein CLV26_101745 [Parapedobacter indicus]SFH93015.1 hypothetical protein SAMN05444682_101731 [Parapedobacter indicus]